MMIDPDSIAFDVDGVLADTMTLFLDIARKDYQVQHVHYEDITCYMLKDCLEMDEDLIETIIQRIQDGSYSMPLKPMTGAAEVLTRLEKYKSPILFVTARPYTGPILDWIQSVLRLNAESIKVITTGSFDAKAEILRDHRVSYFVEDRLETCFQLKDAGVEPVVFRQPWNRQTHPFREVGSWQDIHSLIDWKEETP
jgi:5'(3')-deoxyribonucleotidase